MILKTILSLAYTIALPGYGTFVSAAQAGVIHGPMVVAPEPAGDLLIDLDDSLRSSSERLYSDRFRNYASGSESLYIGWGTLGRELLRHGSICQWTDFPIFSWCTGYGQRHGVS
ncbi:hypothetical protein AB2N04_03105 [Nitratireductor sp. GISD-1A_MAKvit]|uniref:hypothetical protein n=1 Tax=Nitratireductor sp. GISD-1A_MAKvit TaxID=3234198 RepID=UPI003465F23D